MDTIAKILSKKGPWLFLAPIDGLTLTEAVNHEFQVCKAHFVDRDKLPRIRRRLGFPQRISELKIFGNGSSDFFESARTFAILTHFGPAKNQRAKCLRSLKDELALLTLSQLGVNKRRFNAYPRIKGESPSTSIDHWFINKRGKKDTVFTRELAIGVVPLELNRRWKLIHKKTFYFKLIDILNDRIPVQKEWKNNLKTAATLIGESLSSDNVANSFLLNMIALECLLTTQGDKHRTELPKRIEAFLGWAGYWRLRNYVRQINDLYTKRCNLVHAGRRDSITIPDLLFTDDLLLNLLTNIVRHINLFPSKPKLIEFADKVDAEHTLGLKSRVRPKKLCFISRYYTKADYEQI